LTTQPQDIHNKSKSKKSSRSAISH